jgi:hypothetical protein
LNMKHFLTALLGIAAVPALLVTSPMPAHAQTAVVVTACPATRTVPYPAGTLGMPAIDQDGNLCASTAAGGTGSDVNITGINGAAPSTSNPLWVAPGSNTAFPIVSAPRSTMTVAGCTVGTSSAQCLAALNASAWVQVQNVSTSAQIACSWSGAAALNSGGSFMLQPGQSASWGAMSSGVPNSALACIADTAASPLYLEFR